MDRLDHQGQLEAKDHQVHLGVQALLVSVALLVLQGLLVLRATLVV